jgi:hypothetical protein
LFRMAGHTKSQRLSHSIIEHKENLPEYSTD